MILLKLFLTFFKIGLFTVGGGYAMIPLITKEVVQTFGMDLSDIIDFIAVSESTPGPFAVNIATYIGSENAGISGGIVATFGVVLPSFIIILIVARFFEKYKNNKIVSGIMSGLKPAVIGLIAAAVLSICKNVFFPDTFADISLTSLVCSAIITLSMLVLAFKKVHPIFIILICAGLGITLGYCGIFTV